MKEAQKNVLSLYGTGYDSGMATKESTAQYLVDQVQTAGTIRIRKMFGEYALYCNDKVVALVCDDQFYIKPTDAGKQFIGTVEESPPYPGSKPFYVIGEEKWEDREWMGELVRITEEAIPMPKHKKL